MTAEPQDSRIALWTRDGDLHAADVLLPDEGGWRDASGEWVDTDAMIGDGQVLYVVPEAEMVRLREALRQIRAVVCDCDFGPVWDHRSWCVAEMDPISVAVRRILDTVKEDR